MKGQKVMVTGGTGSIGREIVKQLLDLDVSQVVIFSRDEIRQFLMKHEYDDERLKFIIGDIKDYQSIKTAFERYEIDTVFHTAAMKHLVVCEDQPIECANTNVVGTHNLVRLCLSSGVKKMIYLSTDKAASPTSVMGASKFIGERITLNGNRLTSTGQKFCCVRFGNVANSRGSVIPLMVNNMMRGKNIWISHPDVTRFIMRIFDAVRLVLHASSITRGGEIFVLKMKSFKLGDLASVMEKRIGPHLGKKVEVERKNVLLGEKMHEDLLNKEEINFLKEDRDLYMILDRLQMDREYPGFSVSGIRSYDSRGAERIAEEELAAIIMEYVESSWLVGGRST